MWFAWERERLPVRGLDLALSRAPTCMVFHRKGKILKAKASSGNLPDLCLEAKITKCMVPLETRKIGVQIWTGIDSEHRYVSTWLQCVV